MLQLLISGHLALLTTNIAMKIRRRIYRTVTGDAHLTLASAIIPTCV